MIAAAKRFAPARPALNEARRLVRFVQRIPPREMVTRKPITALRVRSNTMLDYSRLAQLHNLAAEAPAGALVECGSYKGGSAGMLARTDEDRILWLFDSWEGLPEPGDHDVHVSGYRRRSGDNYASEDAVRRLLFDRLRVDRSRVHLVKGWFDETLPARRAEIGPIALLHLDCDWYESVKTCLEHLHRQVVPGGVVVVDDYNAWRGCHTAVDEFASAHEIEVYEGPSWSAYWRVPQR